MIIKDILQPVRRYSFPLHLLALLVVCFTFPLIFMGGLVTSHHAGMSVPDWPNSYGYNMFLFPPRLWIGGIFYEHTHRLAATVVGFLSILLTVAAWRGNHPRWLKWLCTSVLLAVIFQGVLGGLRVILVNLDLAIVHGCVAQLFFCFAALVAVVTSKWWISAEPRPRTKQSNRLVKLAFVCVAVILIQLVLGALMRQLHAGLAIPDFPTNYGHVLPPTSSAEMPAINDYRVMQLNLPPVALWQIWLHFSHRIGALCVTVCLLALIGHVLWHNRKDRKLLFPAVLLFFLLAGQITLGILTVLLRKPADIASAHVAGGALIFMTTFVLALRAQHLYPAGVAAESDSILTESLKDNVVVAPNL